MDERFLNRLHELLAGQAADENLTLLQPLLTELWSLHGAPPSGGLATAAPLGARLHAEGRSTAEAVACVLQAGRAAGELAESEGLLDAAAARTFAAGVDAAAVQVAAAVDTERQMRRQQWLSFLSHELKNPLNTILNALWLLRERSSPDKPPSGRVLELAQRAVERLETRIGDVRSLEEHLTAAPPGWEALHRAGQPAGGS